MENLKSFKGYKLKVILTTGLIIFMISVTNAANYVTVATIGNRITSVDKTKGMQDVVEQIKNFWSNKINQVLPDNPDLIVLPEVCDNPGGLNRDEMAEYYEIRKNQMIDFFSSIAKENHCYIVFGTDHEMDNGIWRNSSIIIDREGKIAGMYHKNYPTIGEIESGIVPGKEAPVFKCDFGTVACAICFDLNFTELCDEYASKKPDIILFSSMYHGGLMQGYWAYQCRSFFVGSLAPREVPSEIRNPFGEVIASSTNYFDFAVAKINIDAELVHLDYNWEKLRNLKKKYGPEVIITDPGKLGAVLITSENEDISVEDMIREFDIELLDDYLARARKARN